MFSIEVDRHDYKRAVKNGHTVFYKPLTDFWEVRIWNYPANCKIPIQMVIPGGWNVANGELVRVWCQNVPPEYYNNNPFAFALLVENIKGDL